MARHADRIRSIDYWISDYEGLDPRDIRARDVERIVDLTSDAFHASQVVATHAPGDVEFGMTRMWQLRSPYSAPDWNVGVFRDRDVMLRWIEERLGRPVAAEPGEVLWEAGHDD
jgi:hypothetical protein